VEREQGWAERGGSGKVEHRRRLLARDRHRNQLLQRLDAALRLACLRCLGAEAIDEGLQPRPLGVLARLQRAIANQALLALAQIGTVATRENRERAIRKRQDVIDDLVEKAAVVAYEYDGAAV